MGKFITTPKVNSQKIVDDSLTLFKQITKSPETLADKLVYCEREESFCSCASWRSVILGDISYASKAEAFDATVAKLKEVMKK